MIIRYVFFSIPFFFFSCIFFFPTAFNATGSFACVTFKCETVTFVRLLRGFVSFVDIRERKREREGDTRYFNRTIRSWKAVTLGQLVQEGLRFRTF